MSRLLKRIIDFLSSLGLSCILFLLLLVLTYLGTLYQVEHGLYEAQRKYFESFFLIHRAFGVLPVPLPGTYLVSIVLCANLVLGALVRARKDWKRLGLWIAHAGIVVLLGGSFAAFQWSDEGHMTLNEHEQADVFESYNEWEITVRETASSGEVDEQVIGQQHLRSGRDVTFAFEAVPFTVSVSGYESNCEPRPASVGKTGARVIDGFTLKSKPINKKQGRNAAGAYITVTETGGGKSHEGILWGWAQHPFRFSAGGKQWDIDMHRRRWTLPFTIVLDKFTHERHPGTMMPKTFRSDVTRIEDGVSQQIEISMNKPMRHRGYSFYQSSWGSDNAGPGTRIYSVFSVVRNPADQVPLYACIIITVGLTLYFSLRLASHLRRESKKRHED